MENLRKYVEKIKKENGFDKIMKRYRVETDENGHYICPFCKRGGHSFRIYDNDHFFCRKCCISGDVIYFVSRKQGLNFWQALDWFTPVNLEFPFKKELKLSLERFNTYDPEDVLLESEKKEKQGHLVTLPKSKSTMSPDDIINKISVMAYLEAMGFQVSRTNYCVDCFTYHEQMKIHKAYNYVGSYPSILDIISYHAYYKGISLEDAMGEIEEMLKSNVIPTVEYEKKYLPSNIGTYFDEEERDFYITQKRHYIKEEGLSKKLARDKAGFDALMERMNNQFWSFRDLRWACGEMDRFSYEYLTDKRLLTAETIKRFDLFSIRLNSETVHLFNDPHNRIRNKHVGLFVGDEFLFRRHRIIIPYYEYDRIRFLRGRYFYGRTDVPDNTSKYLCPGNSSYTLSPKRFFNFDIIDEVALHEPLLICENEFNTMLATQLGYNALGISTVSNFPSNQINYIQDLNIHLLMNNSEYSKKEAIEIAKLFNKPVNIISIKKYADLTDLVSNVGEVDLLNDSKYVEVREFQGK